MAELYEDWVVRPMTRVEMKELSPEEKKERKRLQNVKAVRKYKERNPENDRKYREENVEKEKERHRKYSQSPSGKKSNTISQWKQNGLQESKEDLDRIYDLWLHQEFCNACDVKLTRNGDRCSTDACMDHDHDTHRFRHVICRSCNTRDRWKEYFC
tara:strand:+ start:160 stop:627 length:468 start_codon:yes stop_codon:yes gene_type:complete